MKKLLLTHFLVLSTLISFSQTWTSINISTSEKLNKIHFINDDIGFIVGENGTLFRTADSGATWQKITTGITHKLYTVAFLDATTGYINGLKTTDAGLTWAVNTATNNFGIFAIFDSNSIFAGNYFGSFGGNIYKSVDKGVTWSYDSDPAATASYTDYYVDKSTGYLVSWYSGHIIKTTDKGATWTKLLDVSSPLIDDLYGVDFDKTKPNLGLVVGNNNGSEFVKTIDSGASWVSISPLTTTDQFTARDVKIIDENHYVIVGTTPVSSKFIYITTDGGKNWTSATTTQGLRSIDCIKKNKCFAVGDNGLLLSKTVTLSIKDNELEKNELSMYPNPVKDFIFIEGQTTIKSILIFDVLGKKIRQSTLGNNKLYVGDLKKGMYFVQLNNQYKTQKLIIE